MQQPSRRFVYAFSVTVDAFQLFYFDRSGAVHTEIVDIHEEAVTFVQLVRFLASPDLAALGFDPKLYWNGDRRHIDILSGDRVIKYDVDHIMSQNPVIFGGGTTCWIVREAGTTTQLVIKDKWQGEQFGPEADLLAAAAGAGVRGTPRLLAVDETYNTQDGDGLTITSLRKSQDLHGTKHKNRMFSRMVLELYGPSIRHFKSGLQLLQAFRDSIEGEILLLHSTLLLISEPLAHCHLVQAGILHRDISADNIRLGRANGASSGRRNILLNLAQGTRCELGRPAPEKDVFTVCIQAYFSRTLTFYSGYLHVSLSQQSHRG